MDYTITNKPIRFVPYTTAPGEINFLLYPIRGTHDINDITDSKKYLTREKKAHNVIFRWSDSDKEEIPDRIPDYVIINSLKKELGLKEQELNSKNLEIEKLKEKIENQRINQDRELRKEIIKEQLYKGIKKENAILIDKYNSAKKEISQLVTKLVQS